jgi:hypothetical protein
MPIGVSECFVFQNVLPFVEDKIPLNSFAPPFWFSKIPCCLFVEDRFHWTRESPAVLRNMIWTLKIWIKKSQNVLV